MPGEYPQRKREYNRQYALAHPELRRRIHQESEWRASGLDVNFCRKVYDSATNYAICESNFRTGKDKHLDHDHETKRIRGVLCARCNQAIGLLNDDPNLCVRAIEYLAARNVKP